MERGGVESLREASAAPRPGGGLEQREVDRLDELVAEDVIHHDPYDPYAVAGLEGLKASIRATRER